MKDFMHRQLEAMDAELAQRFAAARVHALLSGDADAADKLKEGEFITISRDEAAAVQRAVKSSHTPAAAPLSPAGSPVPAPTERAVQAPLFGRRAATASKPSKARSEVPRPLSTPSGVRAPSPVPPSPVASGPDKPPAPSKTRPLRRAKSTTSTAPPRRKKGVQAATFVHKEVSAWGDGTYVVSATRRTRPKRNWGPGAAKPKPKPKKKPRIKGKPTSKTVSTSQPGPTTGASSTGKTAAPDSAATEQVPTTSRAQGEADKGRGPAGGEPLQGEARCDSDAQSGAAGAEHVQRVSARSGTSAAPKAPQIPEVVGSVLSEGRSSGEDGTGQDAPSPARSGPAQVSGTQHSEQESTTDQRETELPSPVLRSGDCGLDSQGLDIEDDELQSSACFKAAAVGRQPTSALLHSTMEEQGDGHASSDEATLKGAHKTSCTELTGAAAASFGGLHASSPRSQSPTSLLPGEAAPVAVMSRPPSPPPPGDAPCPPHSVGSAAAASATTTTVSIAKVGTVGFAASTVPLPSAAEALRRQDARFSARDLADTHACGHSDSCGSSVGEDSATTGSDVEVTLASDLEPNLPAEDSPELAPFPANFESPLSAVAPTVAGLFPGAVGSGSIGGGGGGLAGKAARSRSTQGSTQPPSATATASLRHTVSTVGAALVAAAPVLRRVCLEACAAAAVPAIAADACGFGADSDEEERADQDAPGVLAPLMHTPEDRYFVLPRFYHASGRRVTQLLARALQAPGADMWVHLPPGLRLPLPLVSGTSRAVFTDGSVEASMLRVVWLPLPRAALRSAVAHAPRRGTTASDEQHAQLSASTVLCATSTVWLYWGARKHAPPTGLMGLWQRTNHFLRHGELTRKDSLQRNLARYMVLGGRMASAFHVMPVTYVLPGQYMAFAEAYGRDAVLAERGGSTKGGPISGEQGQHSTASGMWIVKPLNSSCGRGIRVIRDIEAVNFSEAAVIQRYLSDPMLLEGYKFDLRVYVLVTSFSPLQAFVYSNGLARFSTKPYTTSAGGMADRFVHLTNSSVQKHAGTSLPFLSSGSESETAGYKCSLAFLWRLVRERGGDAAALWAAVKLCILKSLVCVDDVIPHQPSAFELYGFDVMLDCSGKAWLIEVNASPSLACGTPLDRELKTQLMRHTLGIVAPMAVDHSALGALLQTAEREGRTPAEWQQLLARATFGTAPTPYGVVPEQVAQHEARLTQGGRAAAFSGEVPEAAAMGFEALCPNTPQHAAILQLKFSHFTTRLVSAIGPSEAGQPPPPAHSGRRAQR